MFVCIDDNVVKKTKLIDFILLLSYITEIFLNILYIFFSFFRSVCQSFNDYGRKNLEKEKNSGKQKDRKPSLQ